MDHLNEVEAGPARGRALEDLVRELLASVPGVQPADRNVLPVSRVEELDLVLTNLGVGDGLMGFGYDVLVECKSQGNPVNSHTVGWFAQQLRRRRVDWGLLVALSGITGDRASVTAAHREIERSAVEGQRILVVTGDEIRGLRSAAHLVALLHRKRNAMVSGCPHYRFERMLLFKREELDAWVEQHGVERHRTLVPRPSGLGCRRGRCDPADRRGRTDRRRTRRADRGQTQSPWIPVRLTRLRRVVAPPTWRRLSRAG